MRATEYLGETRLDRLRGFSLGWLFRAVVVLEGNMNVGLGDAETSKRGVQLGLIYTPYMLWVRVGLHEGMRGS